MSAVVRARTGSHWQPNVRTPPVIHVMNQTHPTTIGDNVTIGHAAVLHGCTIEDQCLIGRAPSC